MSVYRCNACIQTAILASHQGRLVDAKSKRQPQCESVVYAYSNQISKKKTPLCAAVLSMPYSHRSWSRPCWVVSTVQNAARKFIQEMCVNDGVNHLMSSWKGLNLPPMALHRGHRGVLPRVCSLTRTSTHSWHNPQMHSEHA